ncbi:uncharacterized protein N7469_006296 [Penicillium citrinum]|uniref:Rab-GAP TBC domain-containing protein n=1 Tax=Penicillium citrinum TaxID=5077 RepID=A0A9W9NXP8_PENCI|nr:uncharacterized protein N7469_006296 [Penicillium citrinum]KAJ5231708.1 hypothetical protein N7469_006296 [Penicillium citrinum]
MDSSNINHSDDSSPQSSEKLDNEEITDSSLKSSEESLDTQQSKKARAEKADAIRQACDCHDVEALVSFATSEGGLLEDELRQKAWPIFLQCDDDIRNDNLKPLETLSRHRDEDQVELDVNRSFVYYPDVPEDELLQKKRQLSDLITQVLRNHPMLCYFQGYHDIVQVLLLVLGRQRAAPAMANLSLFRIRDYMLPSLSPAVKHLHLIPAIIETTDPALCQHLTNIQPFFALAATLTLYAHDIQEYNDIARLFDFLLAREPVVAIYLFAAIILSRRKELLDIPVDEPEMLHFTLSKLPCPLDLDAHISSAAQLFEQHPPATLPFRAWKNISRYSVLKTSRDLTRHATADEAVNLFERQARQIRHEERRKQALEVAWKHRRTVGSLALAIAIGVASIYIRKKGLDTSIWSHLSRLQTMVFG